MSQELLVGLGAMASRAGVPAVWLREEATAGRIPHLRAGSRLLFNAEVVVQILRERAGTKPEESRDVS